jgi:hypothetical protein
MMAAKATIGIGNVGLDEGHDGGNDHALDGPRQGLEAHGPGGLQVPLVGFDVVLLLGERLEEERHERFEDGHGVPGTGRTRWRQPGLGAVALLLQQPELRVRDGAPELDRRDLDHVLGLDEFTTAGGIAAVGGGTRSRGPAPNGVGGELKEDGHVVAQDVVVELGQQIHAPVRQLADLVAVGALRGLANGPDHEVALGLDRHVLADEPQRVPQRGHGREAQHGILRRLHPVHDARQHLVHDRLRQGRNVREQHFQFGHALGGISQALEGRVLDRLVGGRGSDKVHEGRHELVPLLVRQFGGGNFRRRQCRRTGGLGFGTGHAGQQGLLDPLSGGRVDVGAPPVPQLQHGLDRLSRQQVLEVNRRHLPELGGPLRGPDFGRERVRHFGQIGLGPLLQLRLGALVCVVANNRVFPSERREREREIEKNGQSINQSIT